MWPPILLDMSKLECKKSLRSLELEAYSMLVSAFRAQGDLNDKKLHILKELQLIFKISIDRHKAELRRATNDEKLYTIAKLLSRDDCVSNEWLKQSKRFIPLLPSLQNTNSYYRILADQILSKSEPIFNLYPDESNHSVTDEIEENKLNETEKEMNETEINENEEDRNFFYLKNGYAVETKSVLIQNIQPSEYVKKFESINETNESNHSKSFLKYLIQKYKQQKDKEENCLINKTKNKLKQEENKSNKLLTTNKQQEVIIQDNLNNQNGSIIQTASLQQTLIPIQIPIQNQHQIKFTNHHHMIKLNNQTHNTATTTTTTSTLVKLPNPTNQLTPKLLIPTKPSSKLIILPTTNQTTGSNTNIQTTQTTQTNNNNLKILTVQPTSLNLNQKILLNVPGLKSINQNTTKNFLNGNELINESYKRKLNDLGMNSICNKNTKNLVCLKLDKFEEDSLVLNNTTTTTTNNNNKNGYHHENDSNDLVSKQNGSSNKRIKLSDLNGTSLNINTNSNNSSNSTNSNSNEILTVTNLNSNSNSTND